MNVTVIGTGYVGLVTAINFAELGNKVKCVDISKEKIDMLKKGISPIYEPGLEEIMLRNIKNGNIDFTTSLQDGINFSEVVFLCVGTPQSDTGKADLSQIEAASRQIAEAMKGYKLIIEKSTVPVNTHKWVKRVIERYIDKNIEFDVASNPEFLREGSAVYDVENPDRIVVGVESQKAREIFEKLYEKFDCPILFTDPATAETIKHAANSFLAMKISYINMVSDICEKTGADIELVAEGIGLDKRIGRSFLNAGVGYGGSCFPKDVKAFIRIAEDNGVDFSLLKEVEKINRQRVVRFIEKIEDILWINKDKRIAVWGLAFKPNTDDIRDAVALKIVEKLSTDEAHLSLYDPKASEHFKKVFPETQKISYVKDKYDALTGADILLILTEWDEFIEADLKKVKESMRLPIIVDGRNIYNPKTVRNLGFEYYSVGRK